MQFHVLSFEGPDPYARAGGLAIRVEGLSRTLADLGFETHIWFVGDPALPGHELRGNLRLHRWGQWISRHYPGGVYDGEWGKQQDYVSSLPPFLLNEYLAPHLRAGGRAVVMAEEWHTVDAVLHLDWLLRQAGLRRKVTLLWNANNTFGFWRIDWPRLAAAAVITTVSRYMRYRMWELGVNPIVLPNGLPARAFRMPDAGVLARLRSKRADRLILTKVARWDPDKRWLLTVDIIEELKRSGLRPLLVARGGVESHGAEVLGRAAAAGLRVVQAGDREPGAAGVLEALDRMGDADVLCVRRPLDAETKAVLFRGSHAVLANSGHEPFGLVGLETMAVGGVACVGGTGEDYAVPGWNALLLQTEDPREFTQSFRYLQESPAAEHALRRRARLTARWFAWPEIIRRLLLPRVGLPTPPATGAAPARPKPSWRPGTRSTAVSASRYRPRAAGL